MHRVVKFVLQVLSGYLSICQSIIVILRFRLIVTSHSQCAVHSFGFRDINESKFACYENIPSLLVSFPCVSLCIILYLCIVKESKLLADSVCLSDWIRYFRNGSVEVCVCVIKKEMKIEYVENKIGSERSIVWPSACCH